VTILRRYRGYVLLSLLWLIFAGGVFLAARWPRPAPIEILPAPAPMSTAQPIRVYVSGAVLQPDVYELPAGSIVKDAIAAAGGASQEADMDAINLAWTLSDGLQVHVPGLAEGLPTLAPFSTPLLLAAPDGAGGMVNINTASREELEALPSIGPEKAQDIINNRPYGAITDILRVPGIGDATFDKLKDRIVVE
jgi:competence protein ComEA